MFDARIVWWGEIIILSAEAVSRSLTEWNSKSVIYHKFGTAGSDNNEWWISCLTPETSP